jgi:hypothetical protein
MNDGQDLKRSDRDTQGVVGFLRELQLGEPWRDGSLEIVPLLVDRNPCEVGVLLTSQAVGRGVLEIVERGEGGVVQQLLARNSGELPVAVLEGDTLVGCKQNRVVGHSLVIGPGCSAAVPVGCMERGRWSRGSKRFEVGDLKISPSMRAATNREMKEARAVGRECRLDQSRLWEQVESELCASGVRSRTSDYNEVVERHGTEARRRARELAPRERQVGVVVVSDGAFVGLEAVGHPALWSELSEPTLASYLMGSHRGSASGDVRRASAREWLSQVQAAQVRATVGLASGCDLDLDAPCLAGIGIALDPGRVIHLAVFAA